MEKLGLEIVGLSYSQTQSGAYALVLGEIDGKRRLPIIIGGFEAQAIAIELENMTPSRPLTHDLFKTFSDSFNIKVKEVIIYNLVEGIFYSKIICEKDGKIEEIDARTSDAIALAVRFKCPIYTFEFILAKSGIILEDMQGISSGEKAAKVDIKETELTNKNGYAALSAEELQEQMQNAINTEDYEEAAKLKKEIEKRKQS